MEIYKQIRKMRLNGMSQRQIAATLHISRNTVKKYWDGDSVPWERKDYSREASVLTEDVVAFVRQCLDEDSQCRSKKQHHTAKRIYDRLVAECGFTGGETTVRRLRFPDYLNTGFQNAGLAVSRRQDAHRECLSFF